MSLRRAVDALQRGRVGRVAAGGKAAGRVAACEPGGGGRGGVPVHPARSTSAVRPPPNRRGPSRLGHAEPNALTSLSHCHRRVRCPVCTGGVTRTERGWVTAVNGAPQLGLGGTVSLEERHGPASV